MRRVDADWAEDFVTVSEVIVEVLEAQGKLISDSLFFLLFSSVKFKLRDNIA